MNRKGEIFQVSVAIISLRHGSAGDPAQVYLDRVLALCTPGMGVNLWGASPLYKNYKRENSGRHGKTLDFVLMDVVDLLAADITLPRRNFDHPLSGEWADHRDCHIKPDLIITYRKPDDNYIDLVRLGSHSDNWALI